MNESYTFSYWEKESFLQFRDFVVIGAGIVGLQAALALKTTHPHASILVLERGFLPAGASTRNAGFACFGSVTEILDDLSNNAADVVAETVKMRYEGLKILRSLVPDKLMDFQPNYGYEVFRSESELQKFEKQIPALNEKMESWLGLKGVYQLDKAIPEKAGLDQIYGAIVNRHEGLLNPGKMMHFLIQKCQQQGIDIKFGTNVSQIEDTSEKCKIQISGGHVMAKKVLVATNGFAAQLLPQLEVEAARNQVLVTSPIQGLTLEGGFHLDAGYFYFRNIRDRILIGGGRHLAKEEEATAVFAQTSFITETLTDLLRNHILKNKKFTIEHSWSGILGIGPQKKPIIRMHSPNLGVAVRMGGMGVAIGTLVGIRAAEMISLR